MSGGSKHMTRTEKALAELNSEIDKGGEYPDWVRRIAKKHRIKPETLRDAYDKQYL